MTSRQRQTARRLGQMLTLLEGKRTMLIVLQDNPDPDALAAAYALKEVVNARAGIQCYVGHGGTIGRSENHALVKYLDLTLHQISALDLTRFDAIAMVDTQPGTGNNSLPAGRLPQIVIDHHPVRRMTRSVPFTDIRCRYGSTATILYEYLAAAGVQIDVSLATALCYGIRSDTQDLGTEAGAADIAAIVSLYPQANKRAMHRIASMPEPQVYFSWLSRGLRNARVFGNTIVSGLGRTDNPDMMGEVADLLLRNESTEWVLCYGVWNATLLASIRAEDTAGDAGVLARRIAGLHGTGGGHRTMAGVQVPLPGTSRAAVKRAESWLVKRFLHLTGQETSPQQRLVSHAVPPA